MYKLFLIFNCFLINCSHQYNCNKSQYLFTDSSTCSFLVCVECELKLFSWSWHFKYCRVHLYFWKKNWRVNSKQITTPIPSYSSVKPKDLARYLNNRSWTANLKWELAYFTSRYRDLKYSTSWEFLSLLHVSLFGVLLEIWRQLYMRWNKCLHYSFCDFI